MTKRKANMSLVSKIQNSSFLGANDSKTSAVTVVSPPDVNSAKLDVI